MTKWQAGHGILECDEHGLVVERFPDGSCSFDIFDASTWPGSDDEGMYYARLIGSIPILEAMANRD